MRRRWLRYRKFADECVRRLRGGIDERGEHFLHCVERVRLEARAVVFDAAIARALRILVQDHGQISLRGLRRQLIDRIATGADAPLQLDAALQAEQCILSASSSPMPAS